MAFNDSLRDTRNRLLANPRFQRWAARFPLVRPIARRRARALFDLCAGFVYSQVLYACVRLEVFEHLSGGPLTLADLADRLGLDLRRAERLLDAAVALDLAERRTGGRYALGALGAALLGNPGVAAMVEHHAMLYSDLADPVALLRGGASQTQLANFWAYAASGAAAGLGSEHVAAYTRLMAASQPLIAQDVLDAWPVDRYRCLLDVGGGNGAFIAAAAARAPELRFQLFDLPAVAGEAEKRFEALGLAGRTAVIGGDFRSDPLPVGADIASLVRVLHDHDDAVAAALLRAVAAALPEDGTLLIAEPMARTPGAMPVGDAYFGFYFLALGQGRARTPRMLIDMARSAGFRKARLIRTARPLLAQVIVAQEPRTTPSVKNT